MQGGPVHKLQGVAGGGGGWQVRGSAPAGHGREAQPSPAQPTVVQRDACKPNWRACAIGCRSLLLSLLQSRLRGQAEGAGVQACLHGLGREGAVATLGQLHHVLGAGAGGLKVGDEEQLRLAIETLDLPASVVGRGIGRGRLGGWLSGWVGGRPVAAEGGATARCVNSFKQAPTHLDEGAEVGLVGDEEVTGLVVVLQAGGQGRRAGMALVHGRVAGQYTCGNPRPSPQSARLGASGLLPQQLAGTGGLAALAALWRCSCTHRVDLEDGVPVLVQHLAEAQGEGADLGG